MRTLIVATRIHLPAHHGGSTHVAELAHHLQRFGPVLTLARRGSTAPGVVGVGRAMERLPVWVRHALVCAEFASALRAARTFAPDVIYERGSSYGLGALLSVALGKPLLTMVLDEHYSWLSLWRARVLVATTRAAVPERVGSKFVQVSWGANTELFRAQGAPRCAQYLPEFAGTTVGYVGSFQPWHGLQDLVTVADKLRDRPIRFVLVGDGKERANLELAIAKAKLSDRFHCAGAVPYADVPGWVAAMDVCVAPFWPDRHNASRGQFVLDPLKIFEYLAMGKPTISVNSDNLRALFENGEHCLLVEPRDIDALVRALTWVLDDPIAARAMGERGQKVVVARHTWAAHAGHLHALFTQLLPSDTQ